MTNTEIFQSKYQELYTPAAGQITTSLGELTGGSGTKKLKRACFVCSADANITYVTEGGNTVTNFPAKASIPYPFLVSKITALSTGTVWILHNGDTVPYSNA